MEKPKIKISRNTDRRVSRLRRSAIAKGARRCRPNSSRRAYEPNTVEDLTPSAGECSGRRVPKRLKVRTAIFSDQSAGCRFESGAPLHRQEALAQSVRAADTYGGQSAWTLFLLDRISAGKIVIIYFKNKVNIYMNKKHVCNFPRPPAKGNWKCRFCG